MKICSFTISLLVLIVFSMNLTSCGAAPVSPTVTPLPTQTSTPTATPTKTETPTPEPTKTPSSEEISQMTDKEKMEKAPEIDGLIKSNVSTVKNNLIIYRDEQGRAWQVYDIQTGETMSLEEAGIIEFDSAGTKVEMQSFVVDNEALDFAAQESIWLNEAEISRFKAGISWFSFTGPQQMLDLIKLIKKIDGWKPRIDYTLPFDDQNNNAESFFQLATDQLVQPENSINGVIATMKNKDDMYVLIFIKTDYLSFTNSINNKIFVIPSSEQ